MKFKKGSMTLGGYVQISDDENNPIWENFSSSSKEPKEETERFYIVVFYFNTCDDKGVSYWTSYRNVSEIKVFSLFDKTYGDKDSNKWFKVDNTHNDGTTSIDIINLNAIQRIYIKEEK